MNLYFFNTLKRKTMSLVQINTLIKAFKNKQKYSICYFPLPNLPQLFPLNLVYYFETILSTYESLNTPTSYIKLGQMSIYQPKSDSAQPNQLDEVPDQSTLADCEPVWQLINTLNRPCKSKDRCTDFLVAGMLHLIHKWARFSPDRKILG